MSIIRFDLGRLRRAALELAGRDARTAEERRYDDLQPVRSIQSLTEIEPRPVRWTCRSCSHGNDDRRVTCWHCGHQRGGLPAVSS